MTREFASRPTRLSLGLLFALTLGACINTGGLMPPEPTSEFAQQMVQVHHRIQFEAGRSELTAAERARLARFLAEMDPKREGKLRLAIAGDQAERLAALRAFLQAEGRDLAGGLGIVPPDDGAILSLDRVVTLPSRCAVGDVWTGAVLPPGNTMPLGCSSSLNLQAMIEQPSDLVRGREPGLAAAQPAVDLSRQYLSRWAVFGPAVPDDIDAIGEGSSRQLPEPPVPGGGAY